MERCTTEGPLHPYRNHRFAQQVPVRFAGMHPTFRSTCGDPPGDRTPEMNEIALRTHVASRPGSVLGFSVRKIIENPYSVGTRQMCVPCMVTVARGKKLPSPTHSPYRCTTEGPLHPYRNQRFAQQVPVRF